VVGEEGSESGLGAWSEHLELEAVGIVDCVEGG